MPHGRPQQREPTGARQQVIKGKPKVQEFPESIYGLLRWIPATGGSLQSFDQPLRPSENCKRGFPVTAQMVAVIEEPQQHLDARIVFKYATDVQELEE
jgi:hypothetical protein